ncbi:protein lifeguard 1-like [Ptychodera flava]|uniref:protein lifeguard 1-like n=1 Tax=Ptychodera flava TaxID=63121 RepID=UPI00396A7606
MSSKGYSKLPSQQEEVAPPACSVAAVDETPLAGDHQATTSHDGTAKPAPSSAEYGAIFKDEVMPTMSSETGPIPQIEEDHITEKATFRDDRIRRAFIRKVYLILMVQLMFTFGIVCLLVFCILYIACSVAFSRCQEMRRKFPTNMIMLALFTLVMSYMAGIISSFYTTKAVLIAIGISGGVCLSVTIFSIQTKFDFTSYIGVVYVMLVSLTLFGFSCIFLNWEDGNIFYAGIGSLVFVVILAVDTQFVIGGYRYEISPEEYVFAALSLYVDIINVFLLILSLLGGKLRLKFRDMVQVCLRQNIHPFGFGNLGEKHSALDPNCDIAAVGAEDKTPPAGRG